MKTPKPLPRHVQERLEKADWGEIIPRLTRYAYFKVRGRSWRSGNKTDLAKGLTAEDLVQEAISDIFTGIRFWDPNKDTDILKFLKYSVLNSKIDNLAKSEDNFQGARFLGSPDKDGILQEPTNPAPSHADHARYLSRDSPNPEEIFMAEQETKEQDRMAKAAIDSLLEAAKDDPEVTRILECTMEGISTPRNIAEYAGVPVEKLYNASKRLQRLLESVRASQQKESAPSKRSP